MDLLAQTAASLVAILALAGLAWWLKLGGTPRLDCEEAVRRAAGEVEDGFTPVAFACDAGGAAALARDASGRIMAIRRHGNRFAGRVLGTAAAAVRQHSSPDFNLAIDPGEPRFGKVFLTLPEPEAWADAINWVNGRADA
jgi:hypothetical protein